jgi:hypothetical protein
MKGNPIEFQSVLATEIADFLRHQRSLGKRFYVAHGNGAAYAHGGGAIR